jgi:hypothetical protein
MSDDKFEELAKRWPHLFEKATCGDIFEVGDGWFTIIDVMCGMICWQVSTRLDAISNISRRPVPDTRMIDALKEELAMHIDELPSFTQVKEKFGSLRIYTQGGTEQHNGYIAFAESMSQRTCEICGNIGNLRASAWVKTRCGAHTGIDEVAAL